MPPERSDTRLLIGAGAAAILAGVLVAVVLSIALLTFVPALLLGPVVQGLTDRLF